MSLNKTAELFWPYGKWKKIGGGASTWQYELVEDCARCEAKAPHEAHSNDLGRKLILQGCKAGMVHMLRGLVERATAQGAQAALGTPQSPLWSTRIAGVREGPFTAQHLQQAMGASDASTALAGHDTPKTQTPLPADTLVTHSDIRFLAPAWLVVAHYTAAFPDQMGGSGLPDMTSACLPGDQRATTNVGGASAPTATPQPQPAPAPAAPTSPESLWDVAMADVDGSSNPEVSAAVAAGLQEFRAGAGYAEAVSNMDLDQEDPEAAHLPDLMDFVMDHLLATEAEGAAPAGAAAASQAAATVATLAHLHLVLDTSVLCNPHGQALLRRLHAAYAPGAASAKAGELAAGSPFVVSAVVPKRVLAELDSLKDATARGDVARAARVAFTMLLEGFRARDGFLALQSRAEYNAAAAAAGEVNPSTDLSVVLCTQHMADLFSKDEGDAGGDPSAPRPRPLRRAVCMSNDNGVCVQAEAVGITAVRHYDLPHFSHAARLHSAMEHLALHGRLLVTGSSKVATMGAVSLNNSTGDQTDTQGAGSLPTAQAALPAAHATPFAAAAAGAEAHKEADKDCEMQDSAQPAPVMALGIDACARSGSSGQHRSGRMPSTQLSLKNSLPVFNVDNWADEEEEEAFQAASSPKQQPAFVPHTLHGAAGGTTRPAHTDTHQHGQPVVSHQGRTNAATPQSLSVGHGYKAYDDYSDDEYGGGYGGGGGGGARGGRGPAGWSSGSGYGGAYGGRDYGAPQHGNGRGYGEGGHGYGHGHDDRFSQSSGYGGGGHVNQRGHDAFDTGRMDSPSWRRAQPPMPPSHVPPPAPGVNPANPAISANPALPAARPAARGPSPVLVQHALHALQASRTGDAQAAHAGRAEVAAGGDNSSAAAHAGGLPQGAATLPASSAVQAVTSLPMGTPSAHPPQPMQHAGAGGHSTGGAGHRQSRADGSVESVLSALTHALQPRLIKLLQEDEDVGDLWEGLVGKPLPWSGADVLAVVAKHGQSWQPVLRHRTRDVVRMASDMERMALRALRGPHGGTARDRAETAANASELAHAFGVDLEGNPVPSVPQPKPYGQAPRAVQGVTSQAPPAHRAQGGGQGYGGRAMGGMGDGGAAPSSSASMPSALDPAEQQAVAAQLAALQLAQQQQQQQQQQKQRQAAMAALHMATAAAQAAAASTAHTTGAAPAVSGLSLQEVLAKRQALAAQMAGTQQQLAQLDAIATQMITQTVTQAQQQQQHQQQHQQHQQAHDFAHQLSAMAQAQAAQQAQAQTQEQMQARAQAAQAQAQAQTQEQMQARAQAAQAQMQAQAQAQAQMHAHAQAAQQAQAVRALLAQAGLRAQSHAGPAPSLPGLVRSQQQPQPPPGQ